MNFVGIAGVAGFVLSLVLAIFEFRRQTARLKIASPELYPMFGDLPSMHVFLRTIVENRSSMPIGISGIDISFSECKNERLNAILGEHSIMGATIRENKSHPRKHGEFKNTPLPINLNPYESCEIVVLFRYKSQTLQEYLHSQLEHSRQKEESIHLPLQIHLTTSRRPICVDFQGLLCDCEDIMQELFSNLRMQ